MKISKRHSTKNLAQNSIEYIVLGNPEPIRKLIFNCGYEVPKDLPTLVRATKELIRKQGRSIISEVLEHHPDKKAILALSSGKKKTHCNYCNNDSYNSEDNFCGACGHSNYNGSGDEDSFLDQFSDVGDKELKRYYNRIVKKSNAYPEDQKLASEVQMVWNEIRQRNAVDKEKDNTSSVSELQKASVFGKDELVLLGVVFIAGYLVGAARLGSS